MSSNWLKSPKNDRSSPLTFLLLTLLNLTPNERVALEPLGEAVIQSRTSTLAQVHLNGLLLASESKIGHWSLDGKRRMILTTGGKPRAFAYMSGIYVVSLEGPPVQTKYFDADGQELANLSPAPFDALTDLVISGPSLYVNLRNQHQEPFPFLAQQVVLAVSPEGVTAKPTGLSLYKANERMRDLYFQFLKTFVVRASPKTLGEFYLVMNQVEPRIYLLNRTTIKSSISQGPYVPETPPYAELKLPKYPDSPATVFNPGFTLLTPDEIERYQATKLAWSNSLGLIRLFEAFGKGYLVAYEIPNHDGEGKVSGYHLGVATLSSSYQLEKFVEITGDPLGIWPGMAPALAILEPNAQSPLELTIRLWRP